jgi:hypothetical protein
VNRIQSFSKELLRIAFLGLGVIGILVKLAVEDPYQMLLTALRSHHNSAIASVIAFASCAAFSLLHIFLTSRGFIYQLNILRYLKRLDNEKWTQPERRRIHDYLNQQREEQKCAIRNASRFLIIATWSLISGAALVAYCAATVLLST